MSYFHNASLTARIESGSIYLRSLVIAGAALLVGQTGSEAATINAKSPALADVNAAINLASSGDTVVVPAGSATWNASVVISKAITLSGSTTTDSNAGTADDKTIITDNIPLNQISFTAPIITLGANARLTGFTFQHGTRTSVSENGAVQISGTLTGVRIDHCHFKPLVQRQNIVTFGQAFGVIDHNVFDYSPETNVGQTLLVFHDGWGGHSYGDGSWADPSYFGTEKFIFFEDNYVRNTTGIQTIGGLDCYFGGRYVARYNHFYDATPNSHGTEGRFRASRAIEVYNNDFHFDFFANMGQLRGGTAVWHDNTWTGTAPSSGMVLQAYRTFVSVTAFGPANGNGPWDINDTHGMYASGTHTGPTGTQVVDSTKNWTPNQWANYTVIDTTTGQIGLIASNTSNTLVYYLYGDFQTVFHTGDSYQIYRLTTAMDQPGRGQGDLVSGDSAPINSTTGKAGWTHDALEPCYSWNNKYNGTTDVKMVTGIGPGNVQEGRDFFNNTVKPNYTPYVYPHPLASGSPKPSSPSNLRIVGP